MFILADFLFIGFIIYWNREKIRKQYYVLRYPEKLIRIIIHYKNNMYSEFWRLIPSADTIIIDKKEYGYTDKALLKENDLFAFSENEGMFFKFKRKKYEIKSENYIKKKGKRFPEIHYFYGYPMPLTFDITNKKIDFNSEHFTMFKDNDLFVKLLTLDDTNMKIMMLIVVMCINLLATLFIIAKLMGWIKA